MKKIKDNDISVVMDNGLLDIGATWCGPCSQMRPIIETISEENPNIAIAECDIDENPEIAINYGIRSVPTFLFFRNGQEVDRVIGSIPRDKLLQKIHERLN